MEGSGRPKLEEEQQPIALGLIPPPHPAGSSPARLLSPPTGEDGSPADWALCYCYDL